MAFVVGKEQLRKSRWYVEENHTGLVSIKRRASKRNYYGDMSVLSLVWTFIGALLYAWMRARKKNVVSRHSSCHGMLRRTEDRFLSVRILGRASSRKYLRSFCFHRRWFPSAQRWPASSSPSHEIIRLRWGCEWLHLQLLVRGHQSYNKYASLQIFSHERSLSSMGLQCTPTARKVCPSSFSDASVS